MMAGKSYNSDQTADYNGLHDDTAVVHHLGLFYLILIVPIDGQIYA
jgi:hypothetical protein